MNIKQIILHTRENPFLAFPVMIEIARSEQNPAASLAAHAEYLLVYVSGVK